MRRFSLAMALLACPLSGFAAEEPKDKPMLVLDAGGHTANIRNLFFTPDGKRLISTAVDSTVRVWDVASGETLRVLRLPVSNEDRVGPGTSHAAALSADGRFLGVAGWGPRRQHAIYLYDLTENTVVRLLVGHQQSLLGMGFSPDGKWLAAGGLRRWVYVWETGTGKLVRVFPGHTGNIQSVAFSPDGQRLASGGRDNSVRVWPMTGDAKPLAEIKGLPELVPSVAWSPDGKTLAVCGVRPTVHLFGADGASFGDIERTGSGEGLSFSADGKTLLAGSSLLDVDAKKERLRFAMPMGTVQSATLSPDGKLAASGSSGPGLFVWNTADGRIVHQLGGKGRDIAAAFWRPDGKAIGWQQIRIAGEKRRPGATFSLPDLKFGPPPGKDYLGAAHSRDSLTLEKIAAHRLAVKRGKDTERELKLPGGIGGITCFTFLGDKYAVVGQTNGLYLYDATTGQRVRTYKGAGLLRSVAPAPDKEYFVAGGVDEVLRVYSTGRETPLLSLYTSDDDWIAWTPEGYYAASPGGERLMGWLVLSGTKQLPAFFTAAQFRKSLYRPDVIRRLLEARSVVKALELVDQAKGTKSERIEVEQVLPPKVSIVSPEQARVTVAEPKFKIKALGQSVGTHPVRSLQLLLDDRPYEGQRGLRAVTVPKMGEVEKEWTVQLTPGTHRLSVLAKSDVSTTVSTAIEVIFKPSTAPAAMDLRPSLYMLSVGINAYLGDMKLDYAVKDATDLTQSIAVKSKSLFREVKTELLTDKQATRQGILDKLDWLKKQMKPHDVAVIFYAGHGHRDEQGRFYLLSIDMDPDKLDKSTVTGEDLKKSLAEMPGRVLLLMDACHSGAIGGRGKGMSITDDLARELSDDDCGVIVMCAAMGSEESRESTEAQHGYFTLAMIEGLGGAADYNKDGLIQLTELDLYVDNRVAQLSKDEQHPVTAKPTTVRSFAVTKY